MRRFLPTVIFIVLDYAAIVGAEFISFFIRNYVDFWNNAIYFYSYSYIFFFVPCLFIIFLTNSNSYRQMKPIVDTMRDIFFAVFCGWIASIIFIYFAKVGEQSSRLYIFLLLLTVLINVCICRYAAMKFFKIKNVFTEKIIVVGAGLTAEKLLKFWREDLGYRYEIVGFIDDHPVSKFIPQQFKILGGFATLKQNVQAQNVNTVIIAAPGIDKIALQNLIFEIQAAVENISFIPDLIGTPMTSVDASILFTEKILMLNLKNNLANRNSSALFEIYNS